MFHICSWVRAIITTSWLGIACAQTFPIPYKQRVFPIPVTRGNAYQLRETPNDVSRLCSFLDWRQLVIERGLKLYYSRYVRSLRTAQLSKWLKAEIRQVFGIEIFSFLRTSYSFFNNWTIYCELNYIFLLAAKRSCQIRLLNPASPSLVPAWSSNTIDNKRNFYTNLIFGTMPRLSVPRLPRPLKVQLCTVGTDKFARWKFGVSCLNKVLLAVSTF